MHLRNSHTKHAAYLGKGFGLLISYWKSAIWIFIVITLVLLYQIIFESCAVSNKKNVILFSPLSQSVNARNDLVYPKKKILFWSKLFGQIGFEPYCINNAKRMSFCPYNCEFSMDQSDLSLVTSDAVVIHGREEPIVQLPPIRKPNQRWVFTMFESAQHSWTDLSHLNNTFNWTLTHRVDSDVVLSYGTLYRRKSDVQFPLNATRLLSRKGISWASSNCPCTSSDRKALVDELVKYVNVDTYGGCGQFECPSRPSEGWMCDFPQLCQQFLGERYKFYLAFENSICTDYITEKFFNALKFNMVPIVHGPSRACYEKHVPGNAFIHVSDFTTIRQLGEYIAHLEMDVKEYLKYFEWQKEFVLDDVNYYLRGWCNLCAKIYQQEEDVYRSKEINVKIYGSIHDWWFNIRDKNGTSTSACITTKVISGSIISSKTDYSKGAKHC